MGSSKQDLLIPKPPPVFHFAAVADFDQSVSTLLKDMPVEVADTHIHPSSFGKWCRRREVLRVLKQRMGIGVPRSKNSPDSKKLLEIGTAVHEHYRDTVLSPLLRGYWRCTKCLHQHGAGADIRPCPEKCEKCGAERHHMLHPLFHYLEISMTDDELLLSGSLDGLAMYRDVLRIIDLKTERDDKWKKREKPNPGHVLQIAAYAGMLKKLLGINITTALIIYINKTDGSMKKSYLVKLDPKIYAWICNEARVINTLGHKYSAQIKDARDMNTVAAGEEFTKENPLRCSSPTEYTALSCASRKECFAGRTKTKSQKKP